MIRQGARAHQPRTVPWAGIPLGNRGGL